MNAPQELLKQYVQSQHFTSTAEIMDAMKDMFRVVSRVMRKIVYGSGRNLLQGAA